MKKYLPSEFNSRILKAAIVSSLFLGFPKLNAFAQSTNGLMYKTVSDGNWNNPGIWNRFDTSLPTPNWVSVNSNELPDVTAGQIEIKHEVYIISSTTADELNIKSGGGAIYVYDQLTIPSNATAGIIVNGELNVLGQLNTNNNIVSGSGSFALGSSGTLAIGSPDGISSSGLTGNIQVPFRTFEDGATYWYNGNTAQLTGNALPQNAKLKIDNSSGVTLSEARTISQLILEQGKLITSNSSLLTIPANGTITSSGVSGFIQGPVAIKVATTGTLNFPVGGGTSKRPISLIINSLNGAVEHTILAEQIENSYIPATTNLPTGVTHISSVRSFKLSKTSAGTIGAKVTLSFGIDDGVTDLGNLTILNYSSGNPIDLGLSTDSKIDGTVTSGSISGGDISLTDQNPTSDLVFANKTGGTNPLPVELLNFSATAKTDQILLNWATASEKNNDHFMVERSKDGVSFKDIAKVNGHGTTSDPYTYQTIDSNPLAGINYYRLKQIDYDGTVTYSSIIKVQAKEVMPAITLYPNPAKDYLKINLNNGGLVKVINSLGQHVMESNLKDNTEQTLSIADLPNGFYQIIVENETGKSFKKFIKSDL